MAGINADPRHPTYIVSPETIKAAGYTQARSVITPDHDMGDWVQTCASAGVEVLPVVARESMEGWDRSWALGDYMAVAQSLWASYGALFTMIQIGNEPDLTSDNSWTTTPEDINLMLEAFRVTWPGVLIVGPGLASGNNPGYADRLDPSLYDVLAIHAYGFMPDDWPLDPYENWIRYLIQQYEHVPKPIWVTEYGGKRGEIRTEAERGAYYRALERDIIEHPRVDRAYAFCLDLSMHPDYGVRDHGNPIPGWDTFPPNYIPATGDTMPGTHPLLGNPWGSDGVLTFASVDGRQITIEAYENGIQYAGTDGSPYNLAHVQEDATDPNVIWVAGKPFRAIG